MIDQSNRAGEFSLSLHPVAPERVVTAAATLASMLANRYRMFVTSSGHTRVQIYEGVTRAGSKLRTGVKMF